MERDNIKEKEMNIYENYRERLYELLALEFNCVSQAFCQKENVLTNSEIREGRRIYSQEKYFFHMVTLGKNAIVTADKCMHPFLNEFIKKTPGHWLFEIPNLKPLEKELNRFGYTLTGTYHMFLPVCNIVLGNCSYSIKWFYEEEIKQFYGDERFPNAICKEYTSTRPDRIVVCAYDGDEMVGMAGCSEDAPDWMQIGIDIMPKYRSQGIGTYLVTILKNKIAEMEKIPFYGTSVSNYHSWNIALNSGFRPAWVEIGAEKI